MRTQTHMRADCNRHGAYTNPHTLMSIAPHDGRRERGLDGGKRREGDDGAHSRWGEERCGCKRKYEIREVSRAYLSVPFFFYSPCLSLFSLPLKRGGGRRRRRKKEDSSLSVCCCCCLWLVRTEWTSERAKANESGKQKKRNFKIGKMKKETSWKVGRRGKWRREEEEGGKPHLKRSAQEKVLREEDRRRDTHNSTELSWAKKRRIRRENPSGGCSNNNKKKKRGKNWR